jgi:superfamily II DNA or RNA helicase
VSGEVGAQARTIISGLSAARVEELADELGVSLSGKSRDERSGQLSAALKGIEPLAFFSRLRREEMRSACKLRGLPWRARSRAELTTTLIGRHVDSDTIARHFRPWQVPTTAEARLPAAGQIVKVRQRQYLVEEVVARAGEQTLVRLVGLDDDDAGRSLQVLWELELGTEIIEPEAQTLRDVRDLDSPRRFAAYLYSLLWNCTTATDPRLFQAHLRAGIKVAWHQLVPLRKALALPRVNLFIADDVGVGKTIEAGLIMQELFLRGQIDRVLVVCPASVTMQWRDEMERRFGQRFEVYGRAFVARRREERGFGVNPWGTFPRFVVSYQTLRRPEHWEPLLQQLGDQARRSLLILDEAHTVAPASSSKYAVDSDVTKAVRNLAPRFEHRLFLSATPHNGHSNSFSSLLEILDPQRFTRGVAVTPGRLSPVMVRRLKADLIRMNVEGYPERCLQAFDLTWKDGRWSEERREGGRSVSREDLGPGSRVELDLSELLARYRKLTDATSKRGRLVLVNLQKRLLSSVEAFARTLNRHAETVTAAVAPPAAETGEATVVAFESVSEDGESTDDEALAEQEDVLVQAASRRFPPLGPEARAVLEELLLKARQGRTAPSAKALSLLAWIRRHQCEAVALGGAVKGKPHGWSNRRLIIFTEYVDTKRYLANLLQAAFHGTENGEERLAHFHGGLSDDQREEVSRAFNGDPDRYPVRILLATDAAREGLNLHARCADLLHWDIPWNPARLEQRNGRIDRALQPEKVVRCGYYVFHQRKEDAVLQTLVAKTETIRRELGSLGAVLMERVEMVLASGIDAETEARLETADQASGRDVVTAELDASTESDAEREAIGEILNRSDDFTPLTPERLQGWSTRGWSWLGADRCSRWPGRTRSERGSPRLSPFPRPTPTARGPAPWTRSGRRAAGTSPCGTGARDPSNLSSSRPPSASRTRWCNFTWHTPWCSAPGSLPGPGLGGPRSVPGNGAPQRPRCPRPSDRRRPPDPVRPRGHPAARGAGLRGRPLAGRQGRRPSEAVCGEGRPQGSRAPPGADGRRARPGGRPQDRPT